MTTCSDTLRTLSTMPLAQISADPAIADHLRTCPSCSRLLTEMAYADQRLSTTLANAIPITPPTQIAADALTRSELDHRESVARWFRRGLAVAAALVVIAFMRSGVGRYMTGADDFMQVRTEINCLTRDNAMRLGAEALHSRRSRIFRTSSGTVTVEGPQMEVNAALSKIEAADRSCELRNPTPAVLSPADGTPKKD